MSYSSKQVIWIEVEANLNLGQNCKSTGKISEKKCRYLDLNYTGLTEKWKKKHHDNF